MYIIPVHRTYRGLVVLILRYLLVHFILAILPWWDYCTVQCTYVELPVHRTYRGLVALMLRYLLVHFILGVHMGTHASSLSQERPYTASLRWRPYTASLHLLASVQDHTPHLCTGLYSTPILLAQGFTVDGVFNRSGARSASWPLAEVDIQLPQPPLPMF